MSRSSALLLILLCASLFVLSNAAYTVNENEQVVVTQFGKITGETMTKPGLHFKLPFVQTLHRFDKRWLEWDGSRNEIPTRDKKYIWVDVYARWRISDAIRFYKRLRDENGAQSRLDDIIDGEVRNVIASHNLIEIVRSSAREFERDDEVDDTQVNDAELNPKLGRSKLMEIVVEKASQVMPAYGIELADVKIKRINYVPSVQQKVFERMISERRRIAERYRSEGQGKSAEIKGKIEREVRTIQSEAFRKAEEIRGNADAKAAAIYAEAYQRDPELYQFLKTLESYQHIVDEKTDLLLSTDSEALKYLEKQK